MTVPTLLRGSAAIGAHLGISTAAAQQLHQHRHLPTIAAGGTPYATPAALDDWQALSRAGKLPTQ